MLLNNLKVDQAAEYDNGYAYDERVYMTNFQIYAMRA
jgi:hypothetical protein